MQYDEKNQLRKVWIFPYGYKCSICGFDFEKIYGEVGKNVIEVHHLKPLYSIGKEYSVNPIRDLVAVCSNCHTIIHKRRIPFTIEEMKEILKHKKLK
ncbi:HNH endonuclease [Clostridium botulinum]|uniref:HNH endonuclease n=1 Tax=Clostridium botulinum TaxID=1491 RepID=UPI000214394E|nr:HNH endonuclease [Clostridium botulinum]